MADTRAPEADDVVIQDVRVQLFGPHDSGLANDLADQVNQDFPGSSVKVPPPQPDSIAFIPVIVGAIAVFGLVHVMKNVWDDHQPATVVDFSEEPKKVYRDHEGKWNRGQVVVIGADGTVKVEQPDRESFTDVVAALIKAMAA